MLYWAAHDGDHLVSVAGVDIVGFPKLLGLAPDDRHVRA